MARSRFQEKILEVSGGVVAYLADLILFMITYGVELSTSGYGSRGAGRAYARTIRELYGIKERSASRGLSNLKCKGYIKYSKGGSDFEITAAAPKIPQPPLDQLKTDGRLVAPIGSDFLQEMVKITKTEKGLEKESHPGFRFVPLVGEHGFKG